MRLDVSVRHLLGVRKADFSVDHNQHGLVIHGANVCGKTSLATAIGLAVCGEGNWLKVPASRRSLYAHNGSQKARAEVRLRNRDGSLEFSSVWTPLDSKRQFSVEVGEKMPPHLVALTDPLLLGAGDYRKMFSKITVSKQIFADGLAQSFGYKDAAAAPQAHARFCDGLYSDVCEEGLDAVLARWQVIRRDQKAAWERSVAKCGVSMRYGKKQAASWRPDGWRAELETQSESDLAAEIDRLDREHTDAIRARAEVDPDFLADRRAEVERGQAAKKGLEAVLVDLDAAIKARDAAIDSFAQRNSELQGLKELSAKVAAEIGPDEGMKCPECGASLLVNGEHLIVYDAETNRMAVKHHKDMRAQIRREEKEIAALQKAQSSSSAAVLALEERRRKLDEEISRAQSAQASLDKAAKAVKSSPGELRDPAELRADHARARADLRMVEAVAAAGETREAASQADAVCDALCGDGPVGREFNSAGMGQIAAMVSLISKEMGQTIEFDDGLILCGQRPVMFASENERFCARVAVRLALALVLKRPLVMFDMLDRVVSAERREALASMVRNWSPDGCTPKMVFFLAQDDGPTHRPFLPLPALHMSDNELG